MRKRGAFILLALVVCLLHCSLFAGGDTEQDTDLAALQIMHRALSIQVGETVEIPVVALKADGSPDTISVA